MQQCRVERADVHTQALKGALSQNIYTKTEVDNMIEEALKRFDERTYKLEIRFEKALNRNLYATIGAIGVLIAVAGVFSTYFHSFAHVAGAG